MPKTDRRVQRTRELLQNALINLMGTLDYDAITIQDIVDQANLGRTTFYLHYNNKDELFISCHEAIVRQFHIGPLHPRSREELLSEEAPAGLIAAYRHLEEARTKLDSIFQGRGSLPMLKLIRDWNAREIEANLRDSFAESESKMPFDVLAYYLAAAQLALVQWWMEKPKRRALEELAPTFHRMQRAIIRDAFGVTNEG